jgi:hypothetical protein
MSIKEGFPSVIQTRGEFAFLSYLILQSIPVLIKHGATTTNNYNDKYTNYRSWYSDSLRAGQSGDRIPLGARFFVPVQTGPGAHPASYTMGTGSLSRG